MSLDKRFLAESFKFRLIAAHSWGTTIDQIIVCDTSEPRIYQILTRSFTETDSTQIALSHCTHHGSYGHLFAACPARFTWREPTELY
jgi:hypothetical protein